MRAPMYQSDAELLEELRKTNPGMAENAVKKDADLYSRLKDVYVESTDPDQANVGDMRREQPGKPFPKDTSQYSYDFVPAQIRQDMPDRGQRIVSKGKVTLQQAVDILAKHKETEGDFWAGKLSNNMARILPPLQECSSISSSSGCSRQIQESMKV